MATVVSSGKYRILGFLASTGFIFYCWLASLGISDRWGLARYSLVTVLLVLSAFFRPRGYLRGVFIYLAVFAALQYWHWRLTQTISFSGVADFTASMLLVMAELYSAALFFLNLFVAVSPLKRALRSPSEDPSRLPTVDVFIPTYNESPELAKITALAACNMIYPEGKVTVHILDDGATLEKRQSGNAEVRRNARARYEELKQFCREAGIRYHTRRKNEHAKAGNLNSALEKSHAELVAVLDCDHVPTKKFLLKTTHYFLKDPKLFLVQTPHFFLNPDPLERNLKLFYAAPGENEMFYRSILPAMDYWESAYFCGSAAVLSRKCLETTGGFCYETVTEDAETSVELHAKGFNSIYLPHPLVCGLAPDMFVNVISQRTRWAQGMIQILVLKNIFWKKGLKWYQRVCYFNAMFFWLFSFARVVFLFAPLFFLFFGLNVYNASLHQVLIYTVPYLMTLSITHNYLHGNVRWPLFSEIYETFQSIYLLPAVLMTFLKPKKPSFKVTAKGDILSENQMSAIAYPFHLIFWLLCFSMGLCVYKFIHEPFYRETLAVTGCWVLFNITILFFTLGVIYERKQTRKFHRAKAWGKISVVAGKRTFQGKLTDLSWTGVAFRIDHFQEEDVNLFPGARTSILYRDKGGEELKIPVEVRYLRTLRKKRGQPQPASITVGGEILLDDSIASIRKKASFVYGDNERWERFWKMKTRRRNTLYVLFYLMRNASLWSLRGTLEFFTSGFRLLKNAIRGIFIHESRKSPRAITPS